MGIYRLKVGGAQFGIRCAIPLAMSHSKFMKFPLPAFFLVASVLVAGCNSLENPVGGLLDTGRDGRVYNAQTGEFEWPKDSQKPRARKPSAATRASGAASPAERQGDGRYFDIQKNQWVEAREERAPDSRGKARPAPSAPVAATALPPAATPPPPPPPRASGTYNASTGQIEWTSFDPSSAATKPAPRKSWWWPF